MRTLKADVSDEAYESWVRFVSEQGLTYASLMEAIGLQLGNSTFKFPRSVISQARRIAAQRRNRQGR